MKEHLNTLILAVAIILAVVIYCFGTRYQIAGGGEMGAYEVDRISGETWWLHARGKMKQEEKPNPNIPQTI